MRRWVGLLLIFTMIYWSCLPSIQAETGTTVYEQEPNDDISTANEIRLDDFVTGTLTNIDVDNYKITIPEQGLFSLWGYSHDRVNAVSPALISEDGTSYFDCGEKEGSREFYCGDQVVQPGTYYIQITSGDNDLAVNGEGYTFNMYFTTPSVNRISGADRYETATKIANERWAEGTEDIVLATGEDFPDALAAGPLAFYLGGPILLTKKNQLPNTVLSFIEKSDVQTVTIVGGTAVISQQVENYLRNTLGLHVNRIAGKDRFETAANIAKAIPGKISEAVIVNGRNYPDALSIAPYASLGGIPILLSETTTLPAVTAATLRTKGVITTTVIGGTNAVSELVYSSLPKPKRIAGQDRYETSLLVSLMMGYDNVVYLASGANFPDALSGSVLAGVSGSPILLTPPTYLTEDTKEVIRDLSAIKFTILGGSGAVSDQVEQDLWDVIRNLE
jgi:putative cell wall-binding protein